jgi:hypothetical protein
MKKAKSRSLVIDASVAHASGGVSATHPEATHTRDFLQAVLTICHKAVMSPAIRDEWNAHQSRFARTWRTSMVARGKLLLSDIDERPDIRLKIEQMSVADNKKSAMQKDCHLLESAIATDNRIVSLDNIARDLFKSEINVHDVNNVMWVNPVVDALQVLAWLEDGAPDCADYKLAVL